MLDAQVTYSKRFQADQVILIDGTFETNKLDLVLLVAVGITSTKLRHCNWYVSKNIAK